MKQTYYLDGNPISLSDLIKAAKKLGYIEANGIYYTSAAAQVLRYAGHTVAAAAENE